MIRKLRHFFLVCFALLSVSGVAFAAAKESEIKKPVTPELWTKLSVEDLEVLKKFRAALESKDYDQALHEAKKIAPDQNAKNSSDPVKIKRSFSGALSDIVLWKKFGDKINPKTVSFAEISRFANENVFLPNIVEIRANVERVAIANKVSYHSSEKYFEANPPKATESQLYLIESKIAELNNPKAAVDKNLLKQDVKNSVAKLWVNGNFSADEEREFLSRYHDQITEEDNINRIDRLLWSDKREDALRILMTVNEDYQKLFAAIIELQKNPRYIDDIISSVPRKLRGNEGLTYRRIQWYKLNSKVDNLIDLMLDLDAAIQYPEKWWSLRRLYAREMIKDKKYKIAYKLLSHHNLPTNSTDFWEAEWTSGWVALRFMDEPKKAYQHFENLRKNVVQPVTISRANYWLGMASQAMGDKKKAIDWYRQGAQYPVFFYGQLSIHKHRAIDPVGAQGDIVLPKDPEITERDLYKMSESRAAQMAYLLAIMGDKSGAAKIFEWLVNTSPTEGQIAVVMRIVNELNDRELDAKISRVAARKNVFFIKDKFQIVREVVNDENAPLVHAIIKQESGFAPTAVSTVGAIGFMQLMPSTAKLVAKDLGIKYNQKKLATDIEYNIVLGSHYIRQLINRFDGSEMLAIASYNAGPNAAQRWINEFYDPRQTKDLDKVIDWIELITYSETRNYVQRIMENLIVYKYLMSRSNYDLVK